MLCVLKKKRLHEMGSFVQPKHVLKLKGKKYLQFYAKVFCLSKPVYILHISLENLNELVHKISVFILFQP